MDKGAAAKWLPGSTGCEGLELNDEEEKLVNETIALAIESVQAGRISPRFAEIVIQKRAEDIAERVARRNGGGT
jgi:hypothetical protein